jgi:hypothetical protein
LVVPICRKPRKDFHRFPNPISNHLRHPKTRK